MTNRKALSSWILIVRLICGQASFLVHKSGHDLDNPQSADNLCLVCLNTPVFDGACPPAGTASPRPELLPWMALVFGLSLSNHWPLMLLVSPAFAVLLWPLRRELFARIGALSWLFLAGLLPYAWVVYRSWQAPAVSFYGPLETLPEMWYFVSRAGYAGVDASPTGGGLDRLRYAAFLLQEWPVPMQLAGAPISEKTAFDPGTRLGGLTPSYAALEMWARATPDPATTTTDQSAGGSPAITAGSS